MEGKWLPRQRWAFEWWSRRSRRASQRRLHVKEKEKDRKSCQRSQAWPTGALRDSEEITEKACSPALGAECPLGATSAELLRVKRYKFPDAHRRPAGHPFDAVRLPVITTCPVQLTHRQKMPHQMLRQPVPFQPLFPLLRADVRVRDLPVQRVREFAGDPIHVLRLRTGEFVDAAHVRRGVGENGGDYLSDISRLQPVRSCPARTAARCGLGRGCSERLRSKSSP